MAKFQGLALCERNVGLRTHQYRSALMLHTRNLPGRLGSGLLPAPRPGILKTLHAFQPLFARGAWTGLVRGSSYFDGLDPEHEARVWCNYEGRRGSGTHK